MKTKSLIIICFFLLVVISCKKYDEGPYLSLRSKKERVIGSWKVKTYLINNIDSTQLFIDKLGLIIIIDISKEGYQPEINTLSSVGGLINLHGNWSFSNNKEEIVLFIERTTSCYSYKDTIANFGHFKASESSTWIIKKLKQKELIIENTTEDKNYKLEFELSSDR